MFSYALFHCLLPCLWIVKEMFLPQILASPKWSKRGTQAVGGGVGWYMCVSGGCRIFSFNPSLSISSCIYLKDQSEILKLSTFQTILDVFLLLLWRNVIFWTLYKEYMLTPFYLNQMEWNPECKNLKIGTILRKSEWLTGTCM